MIKANATISLGSKFDFVIKASLGKTGDLVITGDFKRKPKAKARKR